jgi:hypothetical protein
MAVGIAASLLSVEKKPVLRAIIGRPDHCVIAIIMIKKLTQSYCRLLVDGGTGNGPPLINELQMADRLLPKPQAWGVEKGPIGQTRQPMDGTAFQPEGEILLQICCRCNDRRSPMQLAVAAGGSPGRGLGVYRPGGPAPMRFPVSRGPLV